MTAVNPDDVDRVVKLLVDADDTLTFEAAAKLLRTYRLQIVADTDACSDRAWQAGLLTAVNAGVRAVHGGVRVVLARDAPCTVPWAQGRRLSQALVELGAEIVADDGGLDSGVPTIALGDGQNAASAAAGVMRAPVVCTSAGRWIAGVAPAGDDVAGEVETASVLGAVMASTMAVSECFQWLRGHAVAGDRRVRVSVWDPEGGLDGPPIRDLPAALWLLGLGHLGQAYAWLLSLLPYPTAGGRRLVLQDDDRLSVANRATSMMHRATHVGTQKTRLAAAAMDPLGWDTALVERRYNGGSVYVSGDPQVLLGGVDNVVARRQLDDTGFPLIFDAGLGAGPDGFLGMTVRRLPDGRPSREIWPAERENIAPAAALAGAAYAALEAETGDHCGVELLAGRTVATAFVGVTAACWVIGGLLRELHGGPAFTLVDYSLREPSSVVAVPAPGARPPRVATTPCSV
jgi:hypothetical protein